MKLFKIRLFKHFFLSYDGVKISNPNFIIDHFSEIRLTSMNQKGQNNLKTVGTKHPHATD